LHGGPIPGDNDPGQHAFVMTGKAVLFLSHLTMLHHEEHMYELVLRASLPPEAMANYVADSEAHPTETYFLANVEKDKLTVPQLQTGARDSFTGEVFRGIREDHHYDRGWPWKDVTPLIADVLVTVERVVAYRHFDLSLEYPPSLTYLLYGAGKEAYLCHYQTHEPNFDQVVTLVEAPSWLPQEKLQAGVHINVRSLQNSPPWAAFPAMARYLADGGFRSLDAEKRDKLLYWYVHTFLWGRYAGSTETVLNRDLQILEREGVDGLIQEIRSSRGDLRVRPNDFVAWSRGARFYPLLYMITRVNHARDWGNGLELHHQLLGYQSALELHHIFPKARLYEHGYSRPEVNSLANFAFLTMETNREVMDRFPETYLPEYESKHPGTIASHWIPNDPELWRIECYRDFLAARRELLAQAANHFLDSLIAGTAVAYEELEAPIIIAERPPVEPVEDDEERIIRECQEWVESVGFARGEESHELVDPRTGEQLAILDLGWPNGLQEELTEPVALLVNETAEVETVAGAMGFRFFTEVEAFQNYVRLELLEEPAEAAA
jgi:hypothetical protein